LAEVAGSLPRALHALGHDVRIVLPCYDAILKDQRGEQICSCSANLGTKTVHGALRRTSLPDTSIPVYLVEHFDYFERGHPYLNAAGKEYPDNAERFCFFCMAVLDGVAQTGWKPDVVHCNDWHTAAIPAYIKTRLADDSFWRAMPTLFTIHNLAYQGRYDVSHLSQTGFGWDLFKPDFLEFYGDINLMKAGIAFADRLNTVSATYAEEIQTPDLGNGLDGFLRTRRDDLCGILNGVDYDRWNPATDPDIPANYTQADMSGKGRCKLALQRDLGLPEKASVPLIALVSRLDWQKGSDLVVEALQSLLPQRVQIVVLGTGDPELEAAFTEFEAGHETQVRTLLRYDANLSHRVLAAADYLLMPSRFEPCGLTQLYAMAYGTIPIVRHTGGLADTVVDLAADSGAGTGIVFQDATPEAVLAAVQRALALFPRPEPFHNARMACMEQDFSWTRSAEAYVHLYRQALTSL
jgi:starch synthase